MQPRDLREVERIGDLVHPNHPEDPAIFAERLQLYPAGCFVLTHGPEHLGYAIGHPWLSGHPPALNTRLETLPKNADTFYIHDVALLAAIRGHGLGEQAVALLVQAARTARVSTLSLVAVGGSHLFWAKQGFIPTPVRKTLASYGTDACFMMRQLTDEPP